MAKKIGILGSGVVGQTLAKGLQGLGFEVEVGSRSGGKIDNWDGAVGTFADVSDHADLVIVAVKGAAAESIISSIKQQLADKTVIDTTNPIADKPPVDGVLQYFTTLDDSLMERLQRLAPDAHFVKAFNSIGSAAMVKPVFAGGKPTMFICGNNESAKHEVSEILDKFGWEVEDMGTTTAARAIEPLCMLWCIPGMLRNDWSHAFKLLK
jgi:hypothetical protein